MENSITLDDVELTISALQAYSGFSRQIMLELARNSVDVITFPDEHVVLQDNGQLHIWSNVPLPSGTERRELTIPATEWQWK